MTVNEAPPLKSENIDWGGTIYTTVKRVAVAASCHFGYYTSTGVAAVHTPEIVSYLAKIRYGDGIVNWYARHTFSAAITPIVTLCGGLSGALVLGLGITLAFNLAEACGRVVCSKKWKKQ